METVFITGSAGFIGFYVAKALLEQGYAVVGYDNLNDYYLFFMKRISVIWMSWKRLLMPIRLIM